MSQAFASGQVTLNNYIPGSAPATATVASGALGGATYLINITAITATGESTVSPQASQVCASSHVPSVTVPAIAGAITGYNVYMTTAGSGVGTRQNLTPVVTTTYQLPDTGLIAGAAAPTVDNSALQTVTVFTDGAHDSQHVDYMEFFSNISGVSNVMVKRAGVLVETVPVTSTLYKFVPPEPLEVGRNNTLTMVMPSGLTTTVVNYNVFSQDVGL